MPSFPHAPEPCEHGCATCKSALVGRLREGHRPVIFVGDGMSDRFAVELADVVFAKRHCWRTAVRTVLPATLTRPSGTFTRRLKSCSPRLPPGVCARRLRRFRNRAGLTAHGNRRERHQRLPFRCGGGLRLPPADAGRR